MESRVHDCTGTNQAGTVNAPPTADDANLNTRTPPTHAATPTTTTETMIQKLCTNRQTSSAELQYTIDL